MTGQYRSGPPRSGSSGYRGRAVRNQGGPPDRSLDELWPGYATGGYFDAAGHLKPEYVARNRIVPLVEAMDNAHPRLTMHQVRRFFQHCRAIEARLRSRTSTTWAAEEASFRKLDVAASDAFGKTNRKIPQIFHDFIQRNVATVRTDKDFLQGFLPHFEALVGFGAQFFKERERS